MDQHKRTYWQMSACTAYAVLAFLLLSGVGVDMQGVLVCGALRFGMGHGAWWRAGSAWLEGMQSQEMGRG